MVTNRVSNAEAFSLLQHLKSLTVTDAFWKASGRFVLHIGKTYHVSDIVFDDIQGKFVQRQRKTSQYVIAATCPVFLGGELLVPADQLPSGFKISDISLMENGMLTLWGDGATLSFQPLAQDMYWQLLQPGTQEDRLTGYKDRLLCSAYQKKRWSPQHAALRDKWHAFPLEDGKDCENAVNLKREMLWELEGMEISYCLKSNDMNLFDIGFRCPTSDGNIQKEYALHVTCSLILSLPDCDPVFCWGDSSKEKVETAFKIFLRQQVKQVLLSEENILHIVLPNGRITVTPADDGLESWRLLPINSNKTHLIASDTWLKNIRDNPAEVKTISFRERFCD